MNTTKFTAALRYEVENFTLGQAMTHRLVKRENVGEGPDENDRIYSLVTGCLHRFVHALTLSI